MATNGSLGSLTTVSALTLLSASRADVSVASIAVDTACTGSDVGRDRWAAAALIR